jgi:prophage DNA circulation protein
MTNRDNIRRLVEKATSDLAVVKSLACRAEMHVEDLAIVSDLSAAALTELSVFTDHVETADEAAAVKPLHDRVHVLVVQLRVLRNTLEAMENAAEFALNDVRRISASVEEASPEDDNL